jgi:3-dehydroquinate synthase
MAKAASRSRVSPRKPSATSKARASAAKRGPAAKPAPAASAPAKSATLRVRTAGLPTGQYDVQIGAGIMAHAAEGLLERGQRALLVIDSGVPRELIEGLLRRLDSAGVTWGVRVVQASEAEKSLSTAESILVEAARLRLERADAMIAIGGGIVTDVAGFAAAIYRRGVSIMQCPTTLLAMVDASVGGKTAVNLPVSESDAHAGASGRKSTKLLKNVAGAFHQPARVVVDVQALRSLPPRELRAGMAECVKHGLIGGGVKVAPPSPSASTLLAWLEANAAKVLALHEPTLIDLVRRNIAIKASVVQGDERELSTRPDGGRMMLNLGHTFAHAIETQHGLAWRDHAGVVQSGQLAHGEAVGLGVLAACRLSEAIKLLPRPAKPSRAASGVALSARVEALLKGLGLPTQLLSMPPANAILDRMRDDKKVARGQIRLILPTTGLKVRVRTDVPEGAILAAIETWRGPA